MGGAVRPVQVVLRVASHQLIPRRVSHRHRCPHGKLPGTTMLLRQGCSEQRQTRARMTNIINNGITMPVKRRTSIRTVLTKEPMVRMTVPSCLAGDAYHLESQQQRRVLTSLPPWKRASAMDNHSSDLRHDRQVRDLVLEAVHRHRSQHGKMEKQFIEIIQFPASFLHVNR